MPDTAADKQSSGCISLGNKKALCSTKIKLGNEIHSLPLNFLTPFNAVATESDQEWMKFLPSSGGHYHQFARNLNSYFASKKVSFFSTRNNPQQGLHQSAPYKLHICLQTSYRPVRSVHLAFFHFWASIESAYRIFFLRKNSVVATRRLDQRTQTAAALRREHANRHEAEAHTYVPWATKLEGEPMKPARRTV